MEEPVVIKEEALKKSIELAKEKGFRTNELDFFIKLSGTSWIVEGYPKKPIRGRSITVEVDIKSGEVVGYTVKE